MQQFHPPFWHIKKHLYRIFASVLLFAFVLVSHAYAQQTDLPSYKTPLTLTQSPMQTRDDAFNVLTSDAFIEQLGHLAQQLPDATVDAQSRFNRTALLSAQGQHLRLLEEIAGFDNALSYTHYRLHSETLLQLSKDGTETFANILRTRFTKTANSATNEQAYQLLGALSWSVERALDFVFNVFKNYYEKDTLSEKEVIDLIVNSHLYHVVERVIPIASAVINEENQHRYDIQPEVLIETSDGTELTLTIVRPKNTTQKQPTAFQFTIYANEERHITTAIHAAAHGYVGVIANTRGKRLSNDEIIPWEFEGQDATHVIDWIAKQDWSNGDVVMYGGSYNGFTQWAAAKHMHPSLKAIAPYVAASLITGLPYENNIVVTGNYVWQFHATNNKTMDNSVYADWQKNNQLLTSFYKSGLPINQIDKIDGRPNPWFQKWLDHPSFDAYYQAMVPHQHEYANIDIPVLTITGYFDGGQISAVDYLYRHYQYNPNADHTLLIGPYTHISAQGKAQANYSNYRVDPVAMKKDTEEVVFAWFDHVLFGQPKPELLKDKVNYQLMGSNQWRHSPSLRQLNQQSVRFYLGANADEKGNFPLLTAKQPLSAVSQTVDMSNRETQHNRAPWPIIQDAINEPNGLVFLSEPFETAQELAGSITGHFSISVNKRDVDIGYNFYAIDKDGKAFHLNNYRSRASYAHDMSKRTLLTPNEKTVIPVVNARFTAKFIEAGGRIALVLNVNKNQDAQVNHGSGKPVNEEGIADAGEPLMIHWHTDTELNIPLKPWSDSD